MVILAERVNIEPAAAPTLAIRDPYKYVLLRLNELYNWSCGVSAPCLDLITQGAFKYTADQCTL